MRPSLSKQTWQPVAAVRKLSSGWTLWLPLWPSALLPAVGHGLHLPATRAELRTRKIHSDGILDKRCPVAASAAPDLYRNTHFDVAHFELRAFATIQWSSPPGPRDWHSPPALHSQSTRLLGHDSAIGNRNVDARAVRLPHVSNEQGSRQEKCRAAQRSAAHSSSSDTIKSGAFDQPERGRRDSTVYWLAPWPMPAFFCAFCRSCG